MDGWSLLVWFVGSICCVAAAVLLAEVSAATGGPCTTGRPDKCVIRRRSDPEADDQALRMPAIKI
jgi:hypothetical protein